MQGAEFVNDLCCNYLTVPYKGEENDFALRMLTENATEGFLPLELRRLDGQAYLYYNISGMQNMEIIHAEKVMDRDAFRIFMWQLHDAIEKSGELFLPGDGICLEPSLLFWNLGTQRWEFIYLPGRGTGEIEDIQREREQLAEFLVMRIDYADKKLTDTVYRFYEEICAGRIYPELFLEKEEAEIEKEREINAEQEIKEDIIINDPEEEEEGSDTESSLKTEKTGKGRGRKGILFLLWCAAIAVIFLAGRTMQELIVPGGAVAVLLTVLLLYKQLRQKHEEHEMNPEKEDIIYIEDKIPYGVNEEEPEAAEEKTVYMDIGRDEERKLYGIGKFRKQKIFLDSLPCMVGKDRTLVNYVVSDSSVSRMHARFFMEEDHLWMQDLNSTNGTYHNGLRLRPNERVILEAEDEVSFGRAQFIFR